MLYPSIEDYKIAITIPESFATLNYLIPVLDEQGFPVFIAGGPAVVFKMQDSRNKEKFYALKCFTQEQPQRKHHFEEIHKYLKKMNSPYLVDYQYLENELWVNDAEYPVLMMEWIEGGTMSRKIEELCLADDKKGLARLTYDFNTMAIWLLKQDFAHGDIKPENIQVMPNGDLKLLDYDGMFVPALTGSVSPELGTAEYRHPKRTEADFNRYLDDFPLLLLALSLLSLQKKPELYEPEHQGDSLLFTADNYTALHKSKHYIFFTQEATDEQNISSLFGLLQYTVGLPVLQLIGLENALKEININLDHKRLFVLDEINSGKEVTLGEELDEVSTGRYPDEHTWTDEYGVTYSSDRRRLINGNRDIEKYTIQDGTLVVCDFAFSHCSLRAIKFPDGMQGIGVMAFEDCSNLIGVQFPESLLIIKEKAFGNCRNLSKVKFSSQLKYIERNAFYRCAFVELCLPKSLQKIDEYAFGWCDKLLRLYFEGNSQVMGYGAFHMCLSLNELHFPNGLTSIGESAFSFCENLRSLITSREIKCIKEEAFIYNGIENIWLSEGLEYIGDQSFGFCKELRYVSLPNSLRRINGNPFCGCSNLEDIRMDQNHAFFIFEDWVLYTKNKDRIISYIRGFYLKEWVFYLPETVTEIALHCFSFCFDLHEIVFNKNLQIIEDEAFDGCLQLSKITFKSSVNFIGDNAFNDCREIKEICIPKGTHSHFANFFALKNLIDKLIEI